jgi:exopolysaccharide biosynthesis polyprenyl glycosylphosphotransferase
MESPRLMTRASRSHGLQVAFAVGNIVLFVASYGFMMTIRDYEPKNYVAFKALAPWIVALWLCLFGSFDLFRLRFQNRADGFSGIILCSVLLVVFTFALSFFVRVFAIPRSLVGGAFLLQIVLFSGWRWLFSRFSKAIMTGSKALLVQGSDDDPERARARAVLVEAGFRVTDVSVSDMAASASSAVVSDGYDAVMVTGSIPAAERDDIIVGALAHGMVVYRVPSVVDMLEQSAGMHVIGDTPVLEIRALRSVSLERFAKRAGDIVLAVVLLVLLSPFMGVAALMVAADTGRPVLFFQDRLGLDGRRFRIVKFRTMVVNAEQDTGPVLAAEGDPRITRSGRFLRKSRVDELPQLWNVLRGDMSLVGPRPERPEIAEHIEESLPSFKLRLHVKPGLTGLAQTKGTYATLFEDKLKLDIWYTRSRSLITSDLTILLNTLRTIVTPRRAR